MNRGTGGKELANEPVRIVAEPFRRAPSHLSHAVFCEREHHHARDKGAMAPAPSGGAHHPGCPRPRGLADSSSQHQTTAAGSEPGCPLFRPLRATGRSRGCRAVANFTDDVMFLPICVTQGHRARSAVVFDRQPDSAGVCEVGRQKDASRDRGSQPMTQNGVDQQRTWMPRD